MGQWDPGFAFAPRPRISLRPAVHSRRQGSATRSYIPVFSRSYGLTRHTPRR